MRASYLWHIELRKSLSNFPNYRPLVVALTRTPVRAGAAESVQAKDRPPAGVYKGGVQRGDVSAHEGIYPGRRMPRVKSRYRRVRGRPWYGRCMLSRWRQLHKAWNRLSGCPDGRRLVAVPRTNNL